MKKAIAVLVVAAVGVGAFLWFKRGGGAPGPSIANPFEQPHTLDRVTADFFIESETGSVIAASGRFYWPPQALPGNMAAEFDEARKKKVDEIEKTALDLVSDIAAARSQVASLRSRYFAFLDVLRANDRAGIPFATASVSMIGAAALRSETQVLASQSLSPPAESNAYAAAMIRECRVFSAAEAASQLLIEADLISTHAAFAASAAEASQSTQVKQAATELEAAFAKSGAMLPSLAPVAEKLTKIHAGFRQLEAAGYYYTRAVVDHVGKTLPTMEKQAAAVRIGGDVEEADAAAAKAWVAYFKEWHRTMQVGIDAVDQTRFPAESARAPTGYGAAFADNGEEWYAKGYRYLSGAAESYKNAVETVATTTYDTVKSGVRAAQRTVQFTTDAAGTLTKMAAQTGYHAYMGNTLQDLRDDIGEYAGELRDNWNGKLPPKTTLRQAKDYLDDLENTAEEAAKSYAATKTDKNWLTWLSGKGAKLAVGAFTGIAKGIYLVSDPNSSAGDLLEGTLELALGGLGGSKSLLKPSEVPGASKELLTTGMEALRQFGRSMSRDGLKKRIGELMQTMGRQGADDFGKWLGNMSELAATRQSLEAIEAAGKALRDRLKQRVADAIEKFGDEAGKSLDDLFNKKFADNLKGLLSSIGSQTVGEKPIDLLDNVLAAALDDYLKDGMAGVLDTRLTAEEIKGLYPGTMTVTRLDFDAKTLKESGGEGCMDLKFTPEMLEAMKKELLNKPRSIHIAVHPRGEDGGTMLLTGQGVQETRIPYVYGSDGEVRGTVTERGFSMHLRGAFRKNGSVSFAGSITGGDSTAGIEVSIDATKR
jgi:hypothetical protein